jgi:hypothetical protein
MKLSGREFVVLGFLPLLLAGCQSGGFTRNVSPQVSGRVLAADTHQPLAGVNVARVVPQNFEAFGPPKGGQVLMQPGGVRTDADGRFLLAGESVFALFPQRGWWSAPVSFSCSGYESLQRNFTGTNVLSQSDDGESTINAGDILLQPLVR